MVAARSHSPARIRVNWLVGGVCASAWPFLVAGCATSESYVQTPQVMSRPITAYATAPDPIVQTAYHQSESAPTATAPLSPTPPSHLPDSLPAAENAAAVSHNVPINLDSVLHLAEEHNTQIAGARERVYTGMSEQELAARGWIPRVTAGVDYYRHEGGITLEDGRQIHSSFGVIAPGLDIQAGVDVREATIAAVDSERKLWQQRGELSRVTNETLLEAVNTYLDLLAARRGEEVALDLQKEQHDVLARAEKIAATDRGSQVLVEGIQTELAARRQARAHLHQLGDAAAVKLAYLLGMGPDAMPVPVDAMPKPVDLVDVTPSTADLVARAMQSGPGVQELQSLLNVVQDGFNRLDGPLGLLPTFTVGASEGPYGSGIGASTTWDNRLDVVIGAKWNLTDFVNKKQRTQVAMSNIRQAQISLEDLQGKLTAGVREARDAVISGREQMHEGATMIEHASKAFELSTLRLKQNVPGSSSSEVMAAIRAQEQAHLNYLNAVTAYNKAQIRLLLLLGQGSCSAPAVGEACKNGR